MLIVGSRALKYWFPDYKRDVNDWDFIGTKKEVEDWFRKNQKFPIIVHFENALVYIAEIDGVTYEFEISDNTSGDDYLKISKNKENSIEYASPEILLSLKKSHFHKNLNEKHKNDMEFLLSELKEDSLNEITEKRIKETNIRLNNV